MNTKLLLVDDVNCKHCTYCKKAAGPQEELINSSRGTDAQSVWFEGAAN